MAWMTNSGFRPKWLTFRKKIILADSLLICVPLYVVFFVRNFRGHLGYVEMITNFLLVSLIPIFWLYFLSLDTKWDGGILVGSTNQYELVLISSFKTLAGFSTLDYLIKVPVSRITVLSIFFLSTLSILTKRFLLRRNYLRKVIEAKNRAKFMIISNMETLAEIKSSNFFYSHQDYDFFHKNIENKNDVNTWRKICEELEEGNWHGVAISEEFIPNSEIFWAISTLQSRNNLVVLLYSPIESLIPRFKILKGDSLIALSPPLILGRHSYLKRITDVILSVISLVVLSPIFLLAAIGVKITSPGPILYAEKRIGKNNQLFTFPKFRSMYVGADKMRSAVLGSTDEFISDRYKKDPRITRFGRFIRRWSIDELPQLWCVLIGTMSIVGPRPILIEEEEIVDSLNHARFIAKPGLTGLWQVSGRKEVLWETRMRQDILYIESWTFTYDLLLIFRTFGTIISGKGAV
jgi:exopolysaccharide biosynthesis polyprenyl glycosylphosphotransferase